MAKRIHAEPLVKFHFKFDTLNDYLGNM